MTHTPVLLQKTIEGLSLEDGDIFLDCTVGGAGHAKAIFDTNKKVKIIGIDLDEDAISRSKELLEKIGADYETIKKLMLRNGWINHMHTQVPGTDGKLSYGGYCFPKDTNALLQYMIEQNSPHQVLEATISERNKIHIV